LEEPGIGFDLLPPGWRSLDEGPICFPQVRGAWMRVRFASSRLEGAGIWLARLPGVLCD